KGLVGEATRFAPAYEGRSEPLRLRDGCDSMDAPMEPSQEFRWQALFQRSREPLFVLDRHRRLLFANAAWATLTGLPLAELRGRPCTRRRRPPAPTRWDEVARALAPPAPVLHGQPVRLRRLICGITWDVDFFPLQQDDGPLCALGKVTVVASPTSPAA